MIVLSLDISTSSGYAILQGEVGDKKPTILEYGVLKNQKKVLEYGPYPWGYLLAAKDMADKLMNVLLSSEHLDEFPDVIVIEDTNKTSRMGSRYSQKTLEFIHCLLLKQINSFPNTENLVKYISTSEWRKLLGVQLSKEDKKNNSLTSKAKSIAKSEGIALYEAKKRLGVKGKINKKHVAIRYINELYGLNLKAKDDDIADCLALGIAYFRGAKICDGVY